MLEDYIAERMKEYALNIEEFSIGQVVEHKSNKTKCLIINKTLNSIEVELIRTNVNGINCKQWFDMTSFNRTFKTT